METKVSTPAEAAGVVCPKETGKMPKTDPCTGCQFHARCLEAALSTVEADDP